MHIKNNKYISVQVPTYWHLFSSNIETNWIFLGNVVRRHAYQQQAAKAQPLMLFHSIIRVYKCHSSHIKATRKIPLGAIEKTMKCDELKSDKTRNDKLKLEVPLKVHNLPSLTSHDGAVIIIIIGLMRTFPISRWRWRW